MGVVAGGQATGLRHNGRVPDAVVIGAGVNGLVAANVLADAGWSVLVLEQQPTAGGAVRSDTEVADGFVHDTFSAFYPLRRRVPRAGRPRPGRHGLRWRHAPAVLGNPLPDGRWALLQHDREATAGRLRAPPRRRRSAPGATW